MKLKIFILATFAITFLASGCAKSSSPQSHKIQTGSSTSAAKSDLTQTYTNTKYGYNFNYPEGYELRAFTSGDGVGYTISATSTPESDLVIIRKSGSNLAISFQIYTGTLPLKDEDANQGYAIQPVVEKLVIGGLPGYKLTFPADPTMPYYIYKVQKADGKLLEIQLPKDDNKSAQILNSLKFTN